MNKVVPVILLKELVILPNQEIKIELNNKLSKLIIRNAMANNDGKLLVVAPIDKKEEEPSIDDLPKVGVIATIKDKIQLPNGNIRVNLRGIDRVVVSCYMTSDINENIINSIIEQVELPKYDTSEEAAVRRKLIGTLKEYINSAGDISNSILATITKKQDLGHITDVIASFLPLNVVQKLGYMQNINPLNRAISLINDIREEIKVIELDDHLDDLVQEELTSSQKDYLLKEKLKAIKKELGEDSFQEEETRRFHNLLNKLKLDKATHEKFKREIEKFEILTETSPELAVQRNYLDLVLSLPWNKLSKDEEDHNKVKQALDNSHYGMEDIKNRIIEYVAVKKINKDISSPIICLIGPPGVGKTSIAVSIARALNKKFCKISVGGLNDSTEIIGSRRTYLGAIPGKIIQGLKKCGTKNPVILIDEVDKMVKDYKGDPASTFLEIIDPIQNRYFTDNYVEEPFDLSKVFFILTANSIQDIPITLLDRVEVFELNSYTLFEKKDIAQKYLLPRIYNEHKVTNQIKLNNNIIYKIIKNYTQEAGVRDLERVLTSLTRKIIINNIKNVSEHKVVQLLGREKYEENEYENLHRLGVAYALAATPSGGAITPIEVVKYKGSGKVILTGSLGKLTEESVDVAIGYLKHSKNISLNNIDLHIHFLTAAIKKDGPSGGVAIASAILSLLEKKKLPDNIAFTGELTLNGSILKIGKLKEKLIGAYNKGVNIVYIPSSNMQDLAEIPKEILDNIEIIGVKTYEEIYTKYFK